MKIDVKLNTNGKGFWSIKKAQIGLVELQLIKRSDSYGELRIYFDTSTWDVNSDGLIYTDPLFMIELKRFLVNELGLSDNISYSEEGMQGDDYVSCDAYAKFVASWADCFSVV